MPLLSIQLTKNGANNKKSVALFGSVQKQQLILKNYFIEFPVYGLNDTVTNDIKINTVSITEGVNEDGNFAQKTLKILLKLPFFNNFDINTNSSVSGTIPLFLKECIIGTDKYICNETYRQCYYDFYLSKDVPECFSDFEIYNSYGFVYPINHYKITLNFTYGLEELI